MHTVKGNARTYAFDYITDSVHEVESTYDELRKQEEKLWDSSVLIDELALAENDIKHYQNVAQEKLGYDLEGGNGQFDSEQIERILGKIKSLDVASLVDDVKEVVQDTYHLFISNDAKPISDVIEGVVESVTSLAQQLDKTPPRIDIDLARVQGPR